MRSKSSSQISASQYSADLAILFVALIWGASYAAVKQTVPYTTVSTLIFFRFSIAALLLWPICRQELRQLARPDIGRGLFLGCILSAIFFSETVGVLYTSATNAAFLVSLCILFTPMLEFALKRQLPPVGILLSAAVALAGTGLMVWQGGSIRFALGDGIILLAALLRAAMVVSTKSLLSGRRISSAALTFIQFSAVIVISGAATLRRDGVHAFVPPVDPLFWIGLIFLALFCTLAAFFIQNWAVRKTNPTRVGFLMGTEPLFGAVAAIVLLGEAITPIRVAGAILIFAGTTMGARLSRDRRS